MMVKASSIIAQERERPSLCLAADVLCRALGSVEGGGALLDFSVDRQCVAGILLGLCNRVLLDTDLLDFICILTLYVALASAHTAAVDRINSLRLPLAPAGLNDSAKASVLPLRSFEILFVREIAKMSCGAPTTVCKVSPFIAVSTRDLNSRKSIMMSRRHCSKVIPAFAFRCVVGPCR
jgi:hypothetical protein